MSIYSLGFWIAEPVSNNQFNYTERIHPRIFVPSLIEGGLEDVQMSDSIAIETLVGESLQSGKGLKHFFFLKNARVPTWVCDNHNHAFTFWYEAFEKGYICAGAQLVHIDQHTDLGTPQVLPEKREKRKEKKEEICGFETLEEVEEYTNTVLTIADFILPALAIGLLSEALMVTGESRDGAGTFIWQNNQLIKIQNSKFKIQNSLIVDLDLDYFAQGFDDYETLSTLKYWLAKADIVTIATSPLFIEQERAIEILKSLQKDLLLL